MAMNLGQLWDETVRRAPSATAIIEAARGRVWSRRELVLEREAWCATLPDRRSWHGCRVLMAEPNGANWMRIFLGLIARGAVPVLLDPGEPDSARAEIARTTGAEWWCRNGRLERVGPPRRSRRGDLCLIKLTSGSSGAPRTLGFTHAQMTADGNQICRTMGIQPTDVNLAVIPFGHSYGLGNLVMPLILQGTAIVTAGSMLPHGIARDCERWRPTVFPSVPALLRALVESDVDRKSLASIRLVISAGATLAAQTAEAFARSFGRRVHGFYGSSETGGISYDRTGEATLRGRSVGTLIEGVELHWRPGGRFAVASAAVRGSGRHSPADRGELNSHGELVLLGRTGRMIKVGGRRLDLGEVERLLASLPGVHAAYAAADLLRDEAVAAVVAADRTAAELREELLQRAAGWKVPRRLVVVPEFPVTPRGKTDVRKLNVLLARR